MRILIIGEYSGFANNLKKGFLGLGHNVVLFSWGDGFKKIESEFEEDYNIDVANFKLFNRIIKGTWLIKWLIESFTFKKKIEKVTKVGHFDAVLVLNLDFIKFDYQFYKPYFSLDMIKKVVKSPENIYLSLCGNELIYNSFLASMRKKNPEEVIKRQNPTKRELEVFKTFSSHIPNVIPVMYDYAEPYRVSKLAEKFKLHPTIPLPLDLANIHFDNNVISDKLVIFYGLNRASKGTHIISEALNEIKCKFPDVEVIIDGNMPFKLYLNVISRANIIVDQCYGFSYGMNAIYSMAMGKVVLSCNEPECQDEFKRSDIPILNIEPNVNQIVNTIENLILNPSVIQDLSIKSRRFVEEFHESKIVAQQYIDVFMKNGL